MSNHDSFVEFPTFLPEGRKGIRITRFRINGVLLYLQSGTTQVHLTDRAQLTSSASDTEVFKQAAVSQSLRIPKVELMKNYNKQSANYLLMAKAS